ncbi:MAG: hypothetical protein NXI30_03770, partial [bacterium]|nr:hypothetical protein [bacterium]
VSYPILVLDLVLVTFGLLGARSIYSLWPHSKWLFLGWLLSFFLIGLVASFEMLALDDSLSAAGALVGVLLVGVVGAAGFRYLSRVCRPAV